MSQGKFVVRKVAVLGAGVMGAQIAAHLANAKVPTILFDLPAKEGPKNAIVDKALAGLKKLKPAPLANKAAIRYIQAANYEDDLALLGECDLVIEAVAERLDIKESVYTQVAPHLGAQTIFASNTSGLSIETLGERFPQALKSRFCGVHFFNPPRYMHLVELIACQETDKKVLDDLERFLVSVLGKGVVHANDTPNFIANRIGVFSLLATMHNANKYGLRFDVVDDLTGKRLGRPKSATFRTADVVGLDTFGHVAKTMEDNLQNDAWHALFTLPEWFTGLVASGALGAKTKAGIFKKEGKRIFMFDPASQEYVPSTGRADDAVVELLKIKNPNERLAALRGSDHPQAQFIWACFRDVFHYIAVNAKDIADNARDIDFAIRWGFGWDMGPFETWQAAGWADVAKWIAEDIAKGDTIVAEPLPTWATDAARTGVHDDAGSYQFVTGKQAPRSALDVYQRQYVPAPLVGETPKVLGTTVFETDAVRGFTVDNDILVVSIKTKMHAVSSDVLAGINQAIDVAEAQYRGVVIWAEDAPFSVGADLKSMMPAFASGDFAAIENMIQSFQNTSMRLRYCQVPTVAAVQGFAFGGGCEFVLHCDRTVAALESYIGLVEVGVGLVPGAGGCKEFALRAAQANTGDLLAALSDRFTNIAMAKVATSAQEAVEMGYLRDSDIVVFNAYELLHVALGQAKALADAGYRPAMPQVFKVAGRTGAASIKGQLLNMQVGGFISEYDMHIGSEVATIMTGGEVDAGTEVDEQWLLTLERKAFVRLLQNEKTQDRIANMLTTGKPLRN